jgi:hypothetical protein
MFALVFAFSSVAQEGCASRAVGRSGKPLGGAARLALVPKCKRDTCQARGVGSNVIKLSGAAKKSFMKNVKRAHEACLQFIAGYTLSDDPETSKPGK